MSTKKIHLSMPSTEDFEGTVTEINEHLKCFTLNDYHVINVAYLLFEEKHVELPRVGQNVIIKKGLAAHYNSSGVTYLCKSSDVNLEYKSIKRVNLEVARVLNGTTLLKLIESYRLGIPDLSLIHSNYVNLKNKLLKKSGISPEHIILEAVAAILKTSSIPTEMFNCLNKVLAKFEFKSVSDCKYVDIITINYEEFPYWSFGVHPHKNGNYLIGYLYIHPVYGVTMLKDEDYNILCLIINTSRCDINSFIDNFVLLEKFTVITEIYKDSKVPNVEYILVDLNDIACLKKLQNASLLIYSESDNGSSKHFEHCIIFKLLNKSVTLYSIDNTTEAWLEIEVIESNDTIGKRLLCLRFEYIKLIPILQEKSHYKLCYNGKIDTKYNTELKRIYQNHSQFGLSRQKAVFYLMRNSFYENSMTVAECKSYILSQPKELFSFEGKIKTKKFAEPLSSRTARKISIYGFGTPGPKTHYLEFVVGQSGVKTLSVYINNWESSLMPCGLIPDMQVIVKNVAHQRGKYCKSTALTSFEVIDYLPSLEFSTVNLFTGNGENWGEPFFFGNGSNIPYGVLLWAEVTNLQIRSLKVSCRCLGCNKETEGSSCSCPNGKTLGTKIDFVITMIVHDVFGPAKIISSCLDLLRVLFKLQPREFQSWRDEFQYVGNYEYNNESTNAGFAKLVLCKKLTTMIEAINGVGLTTPLKLCCRKLNSSPSINFVEPLWYCIKAKH